MSIFDFFKSNNKNKDIENWERRKKLKDKTIKRTENTKKTKPNDEAYFIYNSLEKELYDTISEEFNKYKLFLIGVQEKLWPGELKKDKPMIYFGDYSKRLHFPLDENIDFWYKFLLEISVIENGSEIWTSYIPIPVKKTFVDPKGIVDNYISISDYEDIFSLTKIKSFTKHTLRKRGYSTHYSDLDLNNRLKINIQENYEILNSENLADDNELLKRIIIIHHLYDSLKNFKKKIFNKSYDEFLKKNAVYDDEYLRNINNRIMHSKALLYSNITFALTKGIYKSVIMQVFKDFEMDKQSLKNLNLSCLENIFENE